jgi:hypothetical protein
VKTEGDTWITGSYAALWTPWVTTYGTLNGTAITSGATYSAPPLQTAWGTWSNALQQNGPGGYGSHNNHWGTSTICDPYNFGVGWTTSQSLSILRPTRPDYQSGYPRALMFLGSGIASDGPYSAVTQFVTGNANGAPGTPSWIVSSANNISRINLSCSLCVNPAVTAVNSSSGCQAYDVEVWTSYAGFLSDPFWLFINRPNNTVKANDPSGNIWNWTTAWGNGWQSFINYTSTDLCGTTISNYHMNESFSGWHSDYSGTSWSPPTPNGWSVANTQWRDWMSFQCPADNCTPPPVNPPAGCWPQCGTIKIQSATQTFRVGSQALGQGVAVQQDTHQRWKDHGSHEDIVTPAPQ